MHDVIVVGAGPGGSAAAYYLARQGLDVLLLDKAHFPRDKTCGDGLPPRALTVLEDMGVLGELSQVGCRLDWVEVCSPGGRRVMARFPLMAGVPDYTMVVPRLVLDELIRARAVAAGAEFQGGMHVVGIAQDEQGVEVTAEAGGRRVMFSGRAAIVATGASFRLLQRAGILRKPPPVTTAARAYFEGLAGPMDRVYFRFDGLPMPGYGWLFPISPTAANVGAGYLTPGRRPGQMSSSPQVAFEQFVAHGPIKRLLGEARQAGSVKGYPLRVDFATTTTGDQRVLLVGEAAGLVNPLTGEGIDFALESGRMAAEFLGQVFAERDFRPERLAAYDGILRAHYQRLFVLAGWVRDGCLNRPVLDALAALGGRSQRLQARFVRAILGHSAA